MAATEHGGMAGARFVDPSILARIGNLELLARTVVDGFINGLHRAPYFGASIDFAEHRGYVAGDDIRRVDWRDRKSTRLNSSHLGISYAVFCLKKKKKNNGRKINILEFQPTLPS